MTRQPKYPLHILPKHYEEWVIESGVSPRITELNVRSLSTPEEIDKLLNRNVDQPWKLWQHGSGWAVTGVEVETGESTCEGAQFKPDKPVQRYEDGKPKFKKDGSPDLQKYFSASDRETQPLFLAVDDVDYWLKVKNDASTRVIITEGAKKAGAALTVGEACISIPGVNNGQLKGRLKQKIEKLCISGRLFVLGFDSDLFHNRNVCKALDTLGCLLLNKGCAVQVLMLPRQTKGIDDFIVEYGADAFKQLIAEAISFVEWRDRFIENPIKQVKELTANSFVPEVEENLQLKAQAALFSETPWVSIDDKLYKWTGTHYELQSEAVVKRLISGWCKATATYSRDEWRYSYATSANVDAIYSWVLRDFGVDPLVVNPPGLNCLNGVLKISWDSRIPRWELVKHDPSVVYTYVGEFEFNSNADSQACDRLLQCLDAPQRDVFIKTLAASLDLKMIREFKGRATRALLCKGDGNNGKDSLREAVALLYGIGVVNTTVTDFQSYDQGRKFTLAKLEHARISWSSENSSFKQLDNLQSLKAAITGEPIDLERKNQDERQMSLNAVFLFNINDVPNLQASLEAIQSRWAVLSFNKTFKVNADASRGELEADPRFRYDPNFLKTEVVPALLNKMLAALPEVAMNGIDYSCTEAALEEIQEETNHLVRFAREVGLDYQVGGSVSIGEIWETLQKWYVDNGYAEIETDTKGQQRIKILDSGRRGDKPIKQSSDVGKRFLEIFTKAKRDKDTTRRNGYPGRVYLRGIGFTGQANNTQSLVYESISTKIDYLSVEECEMLMTKLANKLDIPETTQPTQHLDTVSDPRLNIGSTSDSTAPLHEPHISNLVEESPATITDSADAVISSLSVGQAKDIHVGSSKNFDPVHHDFKVGDKCKAKYSDIYQIPSDKELTITKIDGNKASVTFPGCRFIKGVDVHLAELCKCNEQG